MAIETITYNPAVEVMADQLQSVRTCLKGSYFVKLEGERFLPHPSSIDKDTTRYASLLAGADFEGFTATTQTSLLSRMNIQDTEILLPKKLEYLRNDADGDGLSLKGMLTTTAKNILPAGWHVLLTDFKGLSDIKARDLSRADVKDMKPRATIKQYVREDVVDWDFARINGRMQLTFILLREVSSELDHETLERKKVTTYLKLAIDDTGYYQQKYTEVDDATGIQKGNIHYIKINDIPLKFIPLEIVADSEIEGGEMPLDAGYLTSISDIALSMYNTSAKLKEVLATLVPALFVYGMDKQSLDEFNETNGRKYIAMGAFTPNFMPRSKSEMEVEILSAKDNTLAFERELESKAKSARAAGAVFSNDQSGQRTATQVIDEATTSSAILTPLSASEESAFERCIIYAGMFEGLYDPDNLQAAFGEVVVDMPSNFGASKITAAEAKEYREAQAMGAITIKTYLKAMKLGGWEIGDIEQELADIELQGPREIV